ncbi:MAG: adenylate kinase family protein [Candidatus Thermoplasmatota archaeon]|nr:adenylate kinase family protein [Candidatus Thermoplasmatota archaeon]
MKIAITGTPGTGKTSVASVLARMGYTVEDTNNLAENFFVGYDEERECKIVDTDAMNDAFKKVKEEGILFVEGHLSHLLNIDFVIVLRCNPYELEKRLEKKKWKRSKIIENLEGEAMDIIFSQACELHDKRVMEIDTTGRKAEDVAREITKIAAKGFVYRKVGKVDWSEWLMEHAG